MCLILALFLTKAGMILTRRKLMCLWRSNVWYESQKLRTPLNLNLTLPFSSCSALCYIDGQPRSGWILSLGDKFCAYPNLAMNTLQVYLFNWTPLSIICSSYSVILPFNKHLLSFYFSLIYFRLALHTYIYLPKSSLTLLTLYIELPAMP